MDYKTIITDVVNSLDPGLAINVTIVTNEILGEAHFVVADIDYPDRSMRIPFILYNDGEVYMPYDWEDELPETALDIDHINWVEVHNHSKALIFDGLPRVFYPLETITL